MSARKKVLFVCLGNICRSPLAEGVFRHLVQKSGLEADFEIDSCGTGSWHVGSPPHDESIRVAARHGIAIDQQRARQVRKQDLGSYDVIVAMDRSNRRDLQKLDPQCTVVLMRDYDSDADSLDVPDPYYGGADGFQLVYDILHRSATQLLEELR